MSDGGDGMGFAPIVTFCIRKGEENLPDFLTAVRREGLPLRRFTGRCGEIPARLYPRLARLAKERGVLLRHTGKRGGYYLFARYRRRLGILAGVTMFFSGLLFSQSFLWAIDVEPTAMVSEQQVLDVLKSHGVRIGTFLPAADLTRVAFYARTELPGLAFFALNRVGSRLEVEMADAVQPPVPQEGSGLCNIVASKPGIVRTVEDYAGEQAVRVGESVAEGQLLISGVVEDSYGGVTLKHAAGRAIASTQRQFSAAVPMAKTVPVPTGRTLTRRSLQFFGLRIPLTLTGAPGSGWEKTAVNTRLRVNGTVLPVSLLEEQYEEIFQQEEILTPEEALAKARELVEEQKKQCKGLKVLEQEELFEESGGVLYYTVNAKCEEDIALETEILVN